MKKKFGFVFLTLICFLLAGLGGFSQNVAFADEVVADAEAGQEVSIDTPSSFVNAINNWATSGVQNGRYILNCDVDFTKKYDAQGRVSNDAAATSLPTLTSTLGTAGKPFWGTFEGRGHTITGLTIDLSEQNLDSQNLPYLGLFGYAENAAINNLRLSGNITLKNDKATSCFVGALVGYAKNTTIKNVDVEATNLKFNDNNLTKNSTAGILAGEIDSSLAENVICRTGTLDPFQISATNNKEIALGCLVGKLVGSKIHSSIVQANLTIEVAENFDGEFKFGGVVGQTNDGSAEIINIAANNNITFNNHSSATVHAGEVVGEISSPSPNQGYLKNISYIHYTDNTIDVFGEQGSYDYSEDPQKNCNITTNQNYMFNSQDFYNNTALWNTDYVGIWDFEHDWYLSGRIENQAFLNDLQVLLSEDFNTKVFGVRDVRVNGTSRGTELSSDLSLRYGDQMEIDLELKTETYDKVTEQFSKKVVDYYNMKELQLTSNYATSSAYRGTIETDGTNMKITSADRAYQIVPHLSEGNMDYFTLKIDGLSMYSSGRYNITLEPKTYTATITSKLYNGNEVVSGEPGYIYNAKATPTTRTEWQADLTYKAEYVPEVHTEPIQTYYYFEGWYVENEDGTTTQIAGNENGNLTLKLGEAYELKNGGVTTSRYFITDDVKIFAKYNEQSRKIHFSIDNSSASVGVEKVVIYEKGKEKTLSYSDFTNNQYDVYIDKENDSVDLEICIKEGFQFDSQFFIENGIIQKSYVISNSAETSKYGGARFTISKLKEEDVGSTYAEIPITIITKPVEENGGFMLWIIIGCVGGVVLLALIGLLIFFIVRRRGGGGGYRGKKVSTKSSYKASRKNFKQMYY